MHKGVWIHKRSSVDVTWSILVEFAALIVEVKPCRFSMSCIIPYTPTTYRIRHEFRITVLSNYMQIDQSNKLIFWPVFTGFCNTEYKSQITQRYRILFCAPDFPPAIWQLSECSAPNEREDDNTHRDKEKAVTHVRTWTKGNFCTEGTSPVYCVRTVTTSRCQNNLQDRRVNIEM